MTKPYLGDLPDPTHVYQESYFYPYSPPQGACREDLVKHRPCPLSGSDDEFVIHRIEGLQFYDDTNADALIEFKVVYNHDSGLIYTNPAYTPEGYARLFKNAAYSFKHSGGNTQDQADWLMERVEDIGKIVDVGCGQGGFLRAVKAKARLGIDTDEQPDLIGVEFVKASVEHIDWDLALQGSWPGPMVVSMLHALEHFTDPVQILKDIRAAARSHTRLFIEVPVLEKAASEDLVGFFSPMHLTHFSVATLRLMLRSCGWQVTHKEYAEGYNGFRVLCSPAEVSTYTPLFSAQKSEILELIVKAAGAHTTAVRRAERTRYATAKVIVWGAGLHTNILERWSYLFREPGRTFCIVDVDPAKTGTTMYGVKVFQPSQVPQEVWQDPAVSVVVSSYGSQPAILKDLEGLGVDPKRIITLYDTVESY